MIERYGQARGLRFKIAPKLQAEIWYCPKDVKIPPHIHRYLDSFIIYLFGRMRVTVEDKTREVCGPIRRRESTGRLTWAVRYIPAGVRHCAEVVGNFAIFINLERCHAGAVSASKDFLLVE